MSDLSRVSWDDLIAELGRRLADSSTITPRSVALELARARREAKRRQ